MKYAVIFGDMAEADRDRLYLARSMHDPEQAHFWNEGLGNAVTGLCDFPGPLAWVVDEKASTFFGKEVRRFLYHGPTRRRAAVPVRVLYTVLPAGPEDMEPEEVILILRLLHGSQSLDADAPASE